MLIQFYFHRGYDHPEFVEGFVNYAKIVLRHYSDRVGTWITFNEPSADLLGENWLSAWNIVTAHAKVVHWYREEVKGTGKWSFKSSFSTGFPIARDPTNATDVAAANRQLDFQMGYLAKLVYLGQQVPDSALNTLCAKSPKFTAAELDYAKGTCDFFAFDIYTTVYEEAVAGGIAECASNSSAPSYPYCTIVSPDRAGWNTGAKSDGNSYVSNDQPLTKFLQI